MAKKPKPEYPTRDEALLIVELAKQKEKNQKLIRINAQTCLLVDTNMPDAKIEEIKIKYRKITEVNYK